LSIFSKGLAKTRNSFFGRITTMLGGSEIDEDDWDDIEAVLIQADMGVQTTAQVIDALRSRGITRADELQAALREELTALLQFPPTPNISGRELSIILIVGVNGSGKTTSIGKLAHRLNLYNRNVLLAAGDTFRAAAIDQLKLWGERANVPVIANKPGSDPAAVVYDATAAAKARGHDILIVDTAGRLHTNFNLMDELYKPYVETARAKGVPPTRRIVKYPLRMALNPFVADIGNLMLLLVSGSVLVSVVMSLPTIGPILLQALKSQDVYMSGFILMFVSALTLVGMLISDILLAILDPRIRIGGGRKGA